MGSESPALSVFVLGVAGGFLGETVAAVFFAGARWVGDLRPGDRWRSDKRSILSSVNCRFWGLEAPSEVDVLKTYNIVRRNVEQRSSPHRVADGSRVIRGQAGR